MEENNGKNIVRFSEEEEEEEEDGDVLKRRISSHPLYRHLIETHLDCLKVGFGDTGEVGRTAVNKVDSTPNSSMPICSELDHFMEAYQKALCELKEAIKDPLQETTAFINAMYFQLKQLKGTHPAQSTGM